jgi:hypothetical protein
MDPTERWFKIALDAGLTLLLGAMLLAVLPWFAAWPMAFLLAHTLNFLFNGHLWGVLKHYGFVSHSSADFDTYIGDIAHRLEAESSIERAAVCGSLMRGEWTKYSDLDIRLLRRSGFRNGLRACWFVLRERTRATSCRFPLDIYVMDSLGRFVEMHKDEQPMPLTRSLGTSSHE